jgi:DNA-binding NarL/FixJ family response regulator
MATEVMKIKIALVDDHQMVREGFADLLELTDNWSVMISCASYREAVELFPKKHIDIAVVDISLPDKSGLDLALFLKQQYPHIKVIIVSMHGQHHFIQKALDNGVLGYVSKQDAATKLVSAVSTVLKGDFFFSEEIQKTIELYKSSSNNELIKQLTNRELDVFKLIALGNNPNQIAKSLTLDPKTVFTHRANIYKKLNINSPFEALKYAIHVGILPLEVLSN